ncbi:MAG: hypothetical protein RL226_150 [Bacteroidota bacterium]
MRALLPLFVLLFVPIAAFNQIICGFPNAKQGHVGCEHGLQGTGIDQFTFIPPPASFDPNAERDVVISVNYNGFSVAAQNAFEYAVDIWASTLTSGVPIIINANWQALTGGTLGFAGADGFYRNFPNAPLPNTFYPSALANKLRGQDLSISSVDISCTFNSSANWYFGTDGNTPSGQYDFVTVVLHELGHGLGFQGSASVSGSTGTIGLSGDPIIYDTFVEQLDGTDVLDLTTGAARFAAFTSNNLYWNGADGLAANSGNRPRLYAPSTWSSGSSYSHLNEGTYPAGNVNSLMTPFIGSAEANHNPGPIVLGMFSDIGWTVGGCNIISITPGTQTACNPATNTYSQQLILEYEAPPASGLINVNGSFFTIQGSPQTISLNNLPSNGLPVNVTAFFTTNTDCSITENNLFTAPASCCADFRITSVNDALEQFTITNFGSCTSSVSSLQICSNGSCALLASLTTISGSTNLSSGSSVTLQWNAWNPAISNSQLTLVRSGGSSANPADLLDYVAWGSAGQTGAATAVSAGIWTVGGFVSGIAPYTFNGGGNDVGPSFWSGSAPPCDVTQIVPGSQSACDPLTNSFSQDLVVVYTNAPASGSLLVNGQSFTISGSPQIVTLTNLNSSGLPVDVSASFSADPSCNLTLSALFDAPESCFCPTDFNNDGTTDIQDFLVFLSNIGCSGSCVADLNNNGQTGADDLLIFMAAFANDCP